MLILEESSFSKVELPSIIYKYRSFEKDEEKRMLTNNEIYLANPDEFIKKGSKDCEFFVKYKEYSYGELLDYYFNNPRYPLSTEDRLTDAIRMANEPPYHDNENRGISEKILKNGINDCLGIFSTSTSWCNEKLWNSKFADYGKGFCVGFNTKKLIECVQFDKESGFLKYHDEDKKPTLTADPLNKIHLYSKEEVKNFIMSLPKKFDKEKEFRLYKQSQLNTPLQKHYYLPNDIIEEAIFGELFDIEKNKDIILELKGKGIKLYQVKYDFIQESLIRETL